MSQENESHLRSIETLAKQLDLYKTKSGPEVDKKVAQLETRARQEARERGLEIERLNEMLAFKDKKIQELTGEIDRLRLVMRAEAEMGVGGKKSNVSFSLSEMQRSVLVTSAGVSKLEKR